MKKSSSVQIGLLASVAALAGCGGPNAVHLDKYGRCVQDRDNAVLSPGVCSGSSQAGPGGYYYGGRHFVMSHPSGFYAAPTSGGTVRGVFGESASGHGGGGGE